MNKIVKALLITLAVLVALLGAAMAFIAATFKPDDYKPTVIRLVKEKTGRTLAIPGHIGLTFFPRLGADLGQLSLSEPGSERRFAAAQQVHVAVALLPLLSRQVVVDRVLLDGLEVHLERDRAGHFNFDDLIGRGAATAAPAQPAPAQPAARPLALQVGAIEVRNGQLSYRDAASGSQWQVAGLTLRSGALADGQPSALTFSAEVRATQPQLALRLQLRTDFTPALAATELRLAHLQASVDGNAAGLKDLAFTLTAPSVTASPKVLQLPSLALEGHASAAQGKLSSRLSGALQGDLVAQRFDFQKLALELGIPTPAGTALQLKAQGQASADLAREAVELGLDGQLDTTTLALRAGMKQFAHPALTLDLALGDLDADRYLPPPAPAPAAATAPAMPQREAVIDLSALRGVDASGAIKVAALKIMNVRSTKLRLQFKLQDGQARLDPLTASLYGGGVHGALSAAAGQPQRLAAKLDLRGIEIGPLLQDALARRPVDGRGNLALNLSTQGSTVSQFKRSLDGTAGVQLQDGAINGINLAGALRDAKARLGGGQQGQADAAVKTDFTELAASFQIKQGVAHNDDLSAKTPLLRLGGSGDIFIAEDRLDYTVKATVVPSLQGQGGPELEQLKGLTIPVHLSGPYQSLSWKIDLGSAAAGRAKEAVEQRKAQIREDAQKKLDEEKAKLQQQLQDQAGDRLKKLLGR